MDNNNFGSDDKRKDMTNLNPPVNPDNKPVRPQRPVLESLPYTPPEQPAATPEQARYRLPQRPAYTPPKPPPQARYSPPQQPTYAPPQQPTMIPVQQPAVMPNQPLPALPISHSPAVAVGRFNDGLGVIWTGLVLNLTALYPLFILLTTLDNPRHMTTMGDWMLICAALFSGTLLAGFGVKEKGYQKDSIRFFGIATFFTGVLFFFIPVVASMLYAAGIGN